MRKISASIIAFFLFTTIKAQVNQQDSLALVDFYKSTNGSNWTNHINWLTASPVSDWHGITVDSNNRVTEIRLYVNNLSGKLLPSIGNLTELKYFSIHIGAVSDTVPATVGNLTKLSVFDIGENNFTGTIPNSIGNLTALTELDLGSNQFTGTIPESIGNLTNLTAFWLEYNQLSGSIPASIGNLKNLNNLVLEHNQLSGTIPESMGNLSKLGNLILQNNELTSPIPASFANLKALAQLFMQNNRFTFDGLEMVVQAFPFAKYSPQAHIPIYSSLGGKDQFLQVLVGGTPKNLLFEWYNGSQLVATNYIDSSYQVIAPGKYSVQATNALLPYFVLFSDTININETFPIKLISLKAKGIDNHAIIEWHTTNEIHVSSFIIQQSIDGVNFTDIGEKDAVGSGNNNYSYVIKQGLNEGCYFRLQVIDIDGSKYYSNATELQSSVLKSRIIIYPNPAKSRVTIKGSHVEQATIIDNNGKIVLKKSLNDATNPVIELGKLARGIYAISVLTNDLQVKTEKLIIQ